jgi:hypothetical protein
MSRLMVDFSVEMVDGYAELVSVKVEVGVGVRSLGVGVEVRPGYCHASTQTDPVPTRDMAV